jgi:Spy/CpxP family protein refolding chaperone
MKITNFKNLFGGAVLGLAILGGGSAASAQETQTQPQTDKQWKHHRDGDGFKRHGRHGGGMRGMRTFGQLNLSDAQKEQMKQISDRHRESTKALREQMFANKDSQDQTARQNLRTQYKAAHEQMRAEMLNILTSEQKTQLEQFNEQRKQLREQRRQQFEQRRKQSQTTTPVIN